MARDRAKDFLNDKSRQLKTFENIMNEQQNKTTGKERAPEVLEAAHKAWVAMADFRKRRERFMRYTFGNQWADLVVDTMGRTMTEAEMIRRAGGNPLTNNLIRRTVKTVVGRYRRGAEVHRHAKKGAGADVSYWKRFNSAEELDARTFEEFLISGMAIQRMGFDTRHGKAGLWIDIVDPAKFFISGVRDVRGIDAEMVGCIRDMSIEEVCMRYAGGNSQRVKKLKRIYGERDGADSFPLSGPDRGEDFFRAPEGRCRVIEVWNIELRDKLRVHDPMNATMKWVEKTDADRLKSRNCERIKHRQPACRWKEETVALWHCRIMAADGTVLKESEHAIDNEGMHPFAVKLYPLVDGDVHPLVEDVIDQQRHVNRLITTMDRMMTTAAKGVLMFPVRSKVDGMDWDDIARIWADPGGVLPYRPDDQAQPHQVVTPVSEMGAADMLKTQIKMFEDVSGVSDALMGRQAASAGVGADRYTLEIENATVAVEDLMRAFGHFIEMRDRKLTDMVRIASRKKKTGIGKEN